MRKVTRRRGGDAAGALLAGIAVAGLLTVGAGTSVLAEEILEPTDWPAAITRLRQQHHDRPGHAPTREQLAIAYNNYGVRLGEDGQWTPAIEQFREALRLEPSHALIRENFSHLYLTRAQAAYGEHRLRDALTMLDDALALNAELAAAYTLLGQIEYDRQRLKEAKAAWERAVALDPSQQEVAERLARLTEELAVESDFERLSQAYFDLRYEEHLERSAGFDLRDALLLARQEVGADFAYWPRYQLIVLIYSPESFRALREETPEWVGGQFDGKIRVPLPGGPFNLEQVRNILFHEYTHALVHDLAKGRSPHWLNEGLAEYEGRRQWSPPLRLLTAASEEGRLIPWSELSGRISAAGSAEEAVLAYEQSYSIVAYLVDRYGFWRIRRLLSALADGRPGEEALERECRATLPQLAHRWEEWLPKLLRVIQ
jgi:tetratricopeptide (TPR) repeat protein